MIGFLLILGGCVVALIWWPVRASQRQSQERYDSYPTTTVAGRAGYRSAAGLTSRACWIRPGPEMVTD